MSWIVVPQDLAPRYTLHLSVEHQIEIQAICAELAQKASPLVKVIDLSEFLSMTLPFAATVWHVPEIGYDAIWRMDEALDIEDK